jgi:hypothetical protein
MDQGHGDDDVAAAVGMFRSGVGRPKLVGRFTRDGRVRAGRAWWLGTLSRGPNRPEGSEGSP